MSARDAPGVTDVRWRIGERVMVRGYGPARVMEEDRGQDRIRVKFEEGPTRMAQRGLLTAPPPVGAPVAEAFKTWLLECRQAWEELAKLLERAKEEADVGAPPYDALGKAEPIATALYHLLLLDPGHSEETPVDEAMAVLRSAWPK